jgi:hypothetical protein
MPVLSSAGIDGQLRAMNLPDEAICWSTPTLGHFLRTSADGASPIAIQFINHRRGRQKLSCSDRRSREEGRRMTSGNFHPPILDLGACSAIPASRPMNPSPRDPSNALAELCRILPSRISSRSALTARAKCSPGRNLVENAANESSADAQLGRNHAASL